MADALDAWYQLHLHHLKETNPMPADPLPTFDDIRQTLVDLPRGDPWGGTSYCTLDLFTVRHDLIRTLQPAPTSVFEFGTLYGYFLVTALDAAPSIDRVGWVDNEEHTPGSNEMCFANVMDVRPDLGYRGIVYATSIESLWDGTLEERWNVNKHYDLVQIDGDHTYDGCLADLRAAHQLRARWIFLDDWTAGSHGDDIQAATTKFRIEHHGAYDLAEHVTVNGLAVLTRKEHA